MTMQHARESDHNHFKWIQDFNLTPIANQNILDVGCGSGHLPEQLANLGANVVGVDIIPPQIQPKSWTFLKTDLESEQWTFQLESSKIKKFDVVLAFDIIEHLSSPWNFLSQLKNLLTDHGRLIITTPNTNSWERFLRPRTWSGVRDPQHKILFNRHSLTFLLQQAGFETTFFDSPIRKLHFLGPLSPRIGAQMLFKAEIAKS